MEHILRHKYNKAIGSYLHYSGLCVGRPAQKRPITQMSQMACACTLGDTEAACEIERHRERCFLKGVWIHTVSGNRLEYAALRRPGLPSEHFYADNSNLKDPMVTKILNIQYNV